MRDGKADFEKAVMREALLNSRIAQTRFKPADTTAEKPKDVVAAFMDAAFANVQKRIETARFIRGKRSIQIDRGDLSYVYPFQSSAKNAAGVTIRLGPLLELRSKSLKRWRKSRPDPRNLEGRPPSSWRDSGVIVHGMLGNLLGKRELYVLELIDQRLRSELAADVADRIQIVDDRLLAAFADLDSLVSFASSDELNVECASDHVCEYIACRWGLEAVAQYANAVLSETPNGSMSLTRKLSEYDQTKNHRLISSTLRIDGVARFYAANQIRYP